MELQQAELDHNYLLLDHDYLRRAIFPHTSRSYQLILVTVNFGS